MLTTEHPLPDRVPSLATSRSGSPGLVLLSSAPEPHLRKVDLHPVCLGMTSTTAKSTPGDPPVAQRTPFDPVPEFRILEKIYLVVHETFSSKPAPIRNLIQRLVALASRSPRTPGGARTRPVEGAVGPGRRVGLQQGRASTEAPETLRGGKLLSPRRSTSSSTPGIFINCGYGLTETTATLFLPGSKTPVGRTGPGRARDPPGRERDPGPGPDSVMQANTCRSHRRVFTWMDSSRRGRGPLRLAGFLHITDRLKDLIRTSTQVRGAAISEARLASCPDRAGRRGGRRTLVAGALLVPDFSRLEEYARQIGLASFARRPGGPSGDHRLRQTDPGRAAARRLTNASAHRPPGPTLHDPGRELPRLKLRTQDHRRALPQAIA